MDILNKKIIILAFCGCLLLQIVFLFAFSNKFLLAEMDFEITVNSPGGDVSGTTTFYATSYSPNGQTLDGLGFYFDNPDTTNPADYGFTGNILESTTNADGSTQTTWSFTEDTTNWDNGNYILYAKGFYGGYTFENTPYISNSVTVNVTNSTNTLDIFFTSTPSTIYGEGTISAYTNIEPAYVEFRISGPQNSTFDSVKDSMTDYHFVWNTIDFPDGYYTVEAVARKETYEAFASFNVTIDNGNGSNTTLPEITVRTENDQTELHGTTYIYADTDMSLDSVTFYLDDLSTPVIDDHSFGGGVSADLLSWSTMIDTVAMPDGDYKFYAKYFYSGSYYESQNYVYVSINNSTNNSSDITITFTSIPPTPFSGEQTICAQTNQLADSVNFKIMSSGSIVKDYSGTTDSTNTHLYCFVWETANFEDGVYDIKVTAKKGTDTAHTMLYGIEILNGSSVVNPLSIQFDNIPPTPISGDQTIYIKANQATDSVTFKLRRKETLITSFYGTIDNTDTNRYYFIWPTTNYADGFYNIEAIANNGTETVYHYLDGIEVLNNATHTEAFSIRFTNNLPYPIHSDQKISISTNQDMSFCIFKIEGTKFTKLQGIIDSTTTCYILLRTTDFPDGYYTIRAYAGNESSTHETSFNTEIKNTTATETYPTEQDEPIYPINDPSTEPVDTVPPDTSYTLELPIECKEKNITTQEECYKYMSTPFECREQNILDFEKCDEYLFKLYMPIECQEQEATNYEECSYIKMNSYDSFEIFPEEKTYDTAQITSPEKIFPEECVDANINSEEECKILLFKKQGPKECIEAKIFTPQECEKHMFEKFAPEDCRREGILNPEACKKYMFEKYSGKENIPLEKLPINCQKANVKTIQECDKIMKETFMPKECKEQGIEDEKECVIYFQQKYMSKECREAEAKSRNECDKIMFEKFAHPECKKAGIENNEECENFMLNKYAPKIKCENIEDWQCKNTLKERHLGSVVAKQIKFEKIREKKTEMIGKSMKASDIENKIIQEKEIVPLAKKDIGIKIIETEESIVLNEEENLIQTPPIAFMIDTDEDGMPDDLEKRWGTNPANVDTDGDGFSDGEEIKNGYNPLGEGPLGKDLSPIDEAIIQNKILEHPKVSGNETENLVVENIKNIEGKQSELSGKYVLSGKSEPNSVTTLYIYSDLPVIITVDTDQYGNWEYELKQSLIDGEHEIYVAINDNTGKVINKSKPLNFFVKEAKAISVKDFITSSAKAAPSPTEESENALTSYMLTAAFLMLFGILLFVIIIIKRKKQPIK